MPDNESVDDHENMHLCGDCKFLFLEDVGTPTHDSHRRLPPRGRRTRYSSSESVENIFSHRFSHMINFALENQPIISGHEDQSIDGDASARLFQPSGSRTSPSDSRRWRRIVSDAESDGLDSLYPESESNLSFSRYRVLHGESDAVSYSAYGGDSDASVDGHSFLDRDMFIPPEYGSIFDSDSDIDPMHAGGHQQWNSDDPEEEEEEEEEGEDGEWEEADMEEDTVESVVVRPQLRNYFSSPSERNVPVNRSWPFQSPEFEGIFRWRTREGRRRLTRNIFANLEEVELIGTSGGDYLDARGFEELLSHLAETDNSRRGAPPAAVSSVNSLPQVIVNKEHQKQEDLVCAICKDLLPSGTEVIQLPCFHLYHQTCILPWLSARNSCPLCRYELPTDDKEYEEGKRNISSRIEVHGIQQHGGIEDSSSDASDEAESVEAREFGLGRSGLRDLPAVSNSGRENGRGRWFLLAASPIVSLVGFVLVLWLGNPPTARWGPVTQPQISFHNSASPSRRENRSRRWWSLF